MDELQVRAGEEFMHFTLDYMALWFFKSALQFLCGNCCNKFKS
jgi:hypothetical protein